MTVRKYNPKTGIVTTPQNDQPVAKKGARGMHIRLPNQHTMQRFFDAEESRLTNDWSASYQHIDEMVFAAGDKLMQRARSMEQNAPNVRGHLSRMEIKVVGKSGFRIYSKAETDQGIPDKDAQRKILQNWDSWTEKGNCTVDGRESFRAICNQIVRRWLVDGEVFIRLYPAFENAWGFAIKLIQPEQIDRAYNMDFEDGSRVRQGVQLDKYDRPTGYWTIKNADRKSVYAHGGERVFIEAARMIHLFVRELPNQTRGFTHFVSGMTRQRMLDAFEFAALVNARVSASKMGFFKKGEGYDPSNDDPDASPVTSAAPGQFDEMPIGMDFVPFDPQPAADGMDQFEKWIMSGVASSLGVSYSNYANDPQGLSFSAHQYIDAADRETYGAAQSTLIENVVTPIFREHLKWSLTTQAIRLPFRGFQRFEKHAVRPRGWLWADIKKQLGFYQGMYEMRLMSLTEIAFEMGTDAQETWRMMQAENKDLAMLDIPKPNTGYAGPDEPVQDEPDLKKEE